MAKLFKFINESEVACVEVQPKNGTDFSLKELQAMVNGYIEIVGLENGEIVVMDEEGLLKGLLYNEKASKYCGFSLVGNILICKKDEVR